MAVSYRSRFLGIMRRASQQLAALYAELAAGIAADLTRAADADGVIPRPATLDIQRRANERITALFLGRNRRGELAPFDTLANGRVMPLSPYMRVLWAAISDATRLPVEQNAVMLARRLPADVLSVMRRATEDPFAEARAAAIVEQVALPDSWAGGAVLVAQIALPDDWATPGGAAVLVKEEIEVFRPNALAKYDAPHTWVDPNGYRLSDRVWNTTARARQQIDLYLEAGIREGKGSLAMSKDLEKFLRPDRVNLRTSKPYGTSASSDGMRLARTEISRAHQEAARVAADMNPFVEGMKWNLSPSHPRPDICDNLARGGPNGDGVYAIDAYPGRPHPNCLCYPSNAIIGDPDAVVDALRDDIRRARQELVNKIGPAQVDAFDKLLLGEEPPPRPVVPTPPPPRPVVPTEPTAAAARANLEKIAKRYDKKLATAQRAYDRFTKDRMEPLYKELDDLLTEHHQATSDAARAIIDKKSQGIVRLIDDLIYQRDGAHTAKVEKITSERASTIRDAVKVKTPATNRLSAWDTTLGDAELAHINSGMDAFNDLVSREVWTGAKIGLFVIDDGERAYHASGNIHVALRQKTGVIVHEIGHAFEQESGVYPKVEAFYNRRTAGDELEKLSDLTGIAAYGDNEVARKDKWLHPYMGKDYGRQSTEIVSMGLEYMYEDALDFARRDSDMFDFIYDLTRGLSG